MTSKDKQIAKTALLEVVNKWIEDTQDGETSFHCWIGDNTASLMTDAAFAVIEALEDGHAYLKREGLLKD